MKMFITFLLCSKLLQSDEWFYFVTDHHGFSFGHVFRNIFSVCLNPYMDAVFILIFEAEEFDVVLHVVFSLGSGSLKQSYALQQCRPTVGLESHAQPLPGYLFLHHAPYFYLMISTYIKHFVF